MAENGKCESDTSIRVKVWSIIVLFLGIFGFFFVTALAHESRITKVETTIEVNIANMTKAIDRLANCIDRLEGR